MGAPQGGLWHAHLALLQVTIIIMITLLICLSSRLLVVKLDFHQRTPDFPGNLAVDKETLIKIGNNDAGQFYELCIEFLDYMDEILALQKGVFSSLDMSKANSMTMGGQCRLAPLIVCIQDSVHLYDYTVKLLFLLHQHLPPDTLSGHAQRFLAQFERLRKFYTQCSNLQYFKHLVQVPSLPTQPPNFAVIAELSSHVTPVAVVAAVPEEEPRTKYSKDNKELCEIKMICTQVTDGENEGPMAMSKKPCHFLLGMGREVELLQLQICPLMKANWMIWMKK